MRPWILLCSVEFKSFRGTEAFSKTTTTLYKETIDTQVLIFEEV